MQKGLCKGGKNWFKGDIHKLAKARQRRTKDIDCMTCN